jgi:hypothetical protein
MPLEIDYRPVIVPPPWAGQRDRVTAAEAAPEAVAVAQAHADMLHQQAHVRDALRRRARWRWRLGLIALVGVLPALLALLGWGDPRGIGGALARPEGPSFHQTAAADGPSPIPVPAHGGWGQALATVHSDADIATPAGPPARPLLATGGGLDHARAVQCLTAAIYYEAAREPDEGQRAVAQVVLNRVAHPAFPKTVCGVVYQGSERPGCQFSFACDGSMARVPMAAFWLRARRVAEAALAGSVYAPIGLATHYHTSAVHPGWADSMTFLGTIGAHRFYRWSGMAGAPRAFNAVYAGSEPLAAPHPRSWVSTGADFADPLVLEKAFEAGRLAALRANPAPQGLDPAIVHAGPAFGQQPLAHTLAQSPDPAARSPVLPGSGAVRPDAEHQYDSAAHWIRQPGS